MSTELEVKDSGKGAGFGWMKSNQTYQHPYTITHLLDNLLHPEELLSILWEANKDGEGCTPGNATNSLTSERSDG